MTKEEWQQCSRPATMLKRLQFRSTDRKFKLFTCACCRRIWDMLPDRICRAAVEVAERFADGEATQTDLSDAMVAMARIDSQSYSGAEWRASETVWYAVADIPQRKAAYHAANQTAEADPAEGEEIRLGLANVVRCIFGDPFRSTNIEIELFTSTVVALSKGIYQERAFERMPILADALEDAGCENADILNHLRGPGPHVRGCWVIDLILGKA